MDILERQSLGRKARDARPVRALRTESFVTRLLSADTGHLGSNNHPLGEFAEVTLPLFQGLARHVRCLPDQVHPNRLCMLYMRPPLNVRRASLRVLSMISAGMIPADRACGSSATHCSRK